MPVTITFTAETAELALRELALFRDFDRKADRLKDLLNPVSEPIDDPDDDAKPDETVTVYGVNGASAVVSTNSEIVKFFSANVGECKTHEALTDLDARNIKALERLNDEQRSNLGLMFKAQRRAIEAGEAAAEAEKAVAPKRSRKPKPAEPAAETTPAEPEQPAEQSDFGAIVDEMEKQTPLPSGKPAENAQQDFAEVPDIEAAKAALSRVMNDVSFNDALDLLGKFGAKKVSEVAEARRAEFVEACDLACEAKRSAAKEAV